MSVLAIDPGNEWSAFVLMQDDGSIGHGLESNDDLLMRLENMTWDERPTMAIEMIASYGMPVGREVFETCVWIGRFIQEWEPCPHQIVYRREVKLHLCNSARAKDANVRQALIDLYGGTKRKAVGVKAKPGPLYGVRKDIWAALGVAVTYMDTRQDVAA